MPLKIEIDISIQTVHEAHLSAQRIIRQRLKEFHNVWRTGDDHLLWKELVFCIFTAGASARTGLRSIEAVSHLLNEGTREELLAALTGVHRYPRARSGYIEVTRKYLRSELKVGLRDKLRRFRSPLARRDWLARERQIKGIGYKESSHFLRNIGYRGYAILDKHILYCLQQLGVIESAQPPVTRTRYIEIEDRMKRFADKIEIDFDELDLVLWSMRAGEILK